jgi:phosphoribosylanthranilate isomerase
MSELASSDLIVKICGLREAEHARVAVDCGADLIGFVFAPTRRYVAPEIVAEIIRDLPRSVPTVGLFVDEQPAVVRSIAQTCGLAYVQLCGDESVDYCCQLGLRLIKSLRVRGPSIAKEVERFAAVAEWCVLDAFQPGAHGGTGTSFDWELARDVGRIYQVIVAGGLTPENVGQAIQTARPRGVDVSSGVESSGRKDPEKIEAFVRAARRAATLAGMSE